MSHLSFILKQLISYEKTEEAKLDTINTKQGFHKQASRILLALNITTAREELKEVGEK